MAIQNINKISLLLLYSDLLNNYYKDVIILIFYILSFTIKIWVYDFSTHLQKFQRKCTFVPITMTTNKTCISR